MKILYFEIEPIQHPYAEEKNTNYEIWSKIKLVHEDSKIKTVLFDWQWDLLEIHTWFSNCVDHLTEQFPYENPNQITISEFAKHIYDKIDFLSEMEHQEYTKKLEEYFSFHYFKIRGTDLPHYYIGVNKNIGEISRWDNENNVYLKYNFEMEKFIDDTKNVLRKTITKWIDVNTTKAEKLIKRIQEIEAGSNYSIFN